MDTNVIRSQPLSNNMVSVYGAGYRRWNCEIINKLVFDIDINLYTTIIYHLALNSDIFCK